MEDFCQLSYRLTQDKYKGSYEQCGRIIKKYSATPGLDLSELFLRVVGSFVMGNSDMHLKNFSLKETEPGSRNFQLSKAYDMLPVNVIMPEDKEQLALTINGKKRNICVFIIHFYKSMGNRPDSHNFCETHCQILKFRHIMKFFRLRLQDISCWIVHNCKSCIKIC